MGKCSFLGHTPVSKKVIYFQYDTGATRKRCWSGQEPVFAIDVVAPIHAAVLPLIDFASAECRQHENGDGAFPEQAGRRHGYS